MFVGVRHTCSWGFVRGSPHILRCAAKWACALKAQLQIKRLACSKCSIIDNHCYSSALQMVKWAWEMLHSRALSEIHNAGQYKTDPSSADFILLLEGGSWASLISDLSTGHQSAQGGLSHTRCIVNAKWISICPLAWVSLPTNHSSSSFPHLYAMDLSPSPSGSDSSYLSLSLPPSVFFIVPLCSVKHIMHTLSLQWPRSPSPLASLGLHLQPATPPPTHSTHCIPNPAAGLLPAQVHASSQLGIQGSQPSSPGAYLSPGMT